MYWLNLYYQDSKGYERIGLALNIPRLDQYPHTHTCDSFTLSIDHDVSVYIVSIHFNSLDQKREILDIVYKIQEALLLKDEEIDFDHVVEDESGNEIEW
jgi:hypothetical protein